jgi:hypothetical protein
MQEANWRARVNCVNKLSPFLRLSEKDLVVHAAGYSREINAAPRLKPRFVRALKKT